MFGAYTIWCDKNKRPRLSKEMLGRQLTKYCPYILAVKHKGNVWKNATFSSDYMHLLSDDTDTSDTLKYITRNNQEKEEISNSYNMKVSDKVSEVSAENTAFCPKRSSPTKLSKTMKGKQYRLCNS